MIGIGIDTGGTCTDAVIYDSESRHVLASGKARTTHHDLKIGILDAVRQMPEDLLARCEKIALSTTIATNACVEDKGGKGKLILIGPDRKIFETTHAEYGIRRAEDVMLVDCRISPSAERSEQPDWDRFRREIPAFLKNCDGVALVQMYAADHNGAYEKKAAELIREQSDIPIVLGHDLFPDRNLYRRGAGALLNARLVPEVRRFMEAIREAFADRGLDLPAVIIKSDGSQMSRKYALTRPVETLLSGPAASVIGARALADADQAMIVDMGGTTTDVALIRNGVPDYAGDGIRIGPWKTFVKGLFVDTFGLGGDTAVHFTPSGRIRLENYRVIPLCSLAAEYPFVLEQLRQLDRSERVHAYFIHEFLCPGKDISDNEEYTEEERILCHMLKRQPLSLEEAAEAAGKDVYSFHTEHLEETGAVLRAGLTPTDIMHIRGEYTEYCTEASLCAARFMVRSSDVKSVEELCDTVYELVTERLYKNLVRILLKAECEGLKEAPDAQMDALIRESFRLELQREQDPEAGKGRLLPELFRTSAKIVCVGAPSHVFLPRVAAMLHTEAVRPPYAAVANAVGAIAGEFTAVSEVTVTPLRFEASDTLEVLTAKEKRVFGNEEEAYAWAEETGKKETWEKAREQGAEGTITITMERIRKEAPHRYGTTWLQDILRFRAVSDR